MKFQYLLTCVLWTLFAGISEISSVHAIDEGVIPREKRSTSVDGSYFYYQQPEYPRDCKEAYDQCTGQSSDGIFLIKPDGSPEPFEVYCNNSIDGGGWTVFQRRVDGSVEFYRTWNEFKHGFGFLSREFWLGNDKISYLTNQKRYELRIDLSNLNGEPFFAKYSMFRISDEGSKYRLADLGEYNSTSTAGFDSFQYHWNESFTTKDQDNDRNSNINGARYDHGAWWFGYDGGACRLNGLYNAGLANHKGIYWNNLPGSRFNITYTEMKIRPRM